MNLKDLLEESITRITPLSATPRLDAQVLIAHILNQPRTWVLAHLEYDLTEEEQDQIDHALKKLKAGEPLPYVLGKWEFYGLEFDITKDVLIPRPETELLVEKAIAWLNVSPERRTVADIGTGSGAIAVSIARHVPDAHILGTDISPAALEVGRRNAIKFNVIDQIDFVECDLLPESKVKSNALSLSKGQKSDLRPTTFDLICANLPYIPTQTMRRLPIYGREPTLALDGGSDGFDLYRRLFKLIPDWLAPHGMILLEIESSLGAQTMDLASKIFPNAAINLYQDLAGKDRLLSIELHSSS
ncbi:MAG: peptide chain release factor N(5)-glutamine methyltransferase [Anaerolineales bacterium]|nr:peptide chain release factor N(5)-glutamine methyltransferase [Anaerolineales bacterium]